MKIESDPFFLAEGGREEKRRRHGAIMCGI